MQLLYVRNYLILSIIHLALIFISSHGFSIRRCHMGRNTAQFQNHLHKLKTSSLELHALSHADIVSSLEGSSTMLSHISASLSPPNLNVKQIVDVAVERGKAGASAGAVQVATLMWLR